MGLFSRTVTTAAPAATSDIEASLAPVNVTSSLYNIYGVAGITASRVEFMSVPTCARARNIISSSVSSIPLKVRTKADGARVESPPKVINQPDPRVPGFCDLFLAGRRFNALRIRLLAHS
jgi:hypothetical protein